MLHCCLFSMSRILEHAQWSRARARRRLWAMVGHFVDPRLSMTKKQRHWRSKREEARSGIHWHLYNPSFVFDCQYMENVSEKHSSKNSRWTTLMQALTAFAKVVPSNQALAFSSPESCTNDCPKQELSVPTTICRRHNLLEMSPWCATPKGAFCSTFCRRQFEKPVSWTVTVSRGVFGFSGNCSSCRKPKISCHESFSCCSSLFVWRYGQGSATWHWRLAADQDASVMSLKCVPMKTKPCKLEGVLGKMHSSTWGNKQHWELHVKSWVLNTRQWKIKRSRDQEHWQLKSPREIGAWMKFCLFGPNDSTCFCVAGSPTKTMRVRSGQERAEFPGKIFLPALLTLRGTGDVVFLRGHQDNVLDARVPRGLLWGTRSGGKGIWLNLFLQKHVIIKGMYLADPYRIEYKRTIENWSTTKTMHASCPWHDLRWRRKTSSADGRDQTERRKTYHQFFIYCIYCFMIHRHFDWRT